ncbi:MAG: NADH-quinone oxidoreductase subunit F [Acholeplasmatales bacterium]|nr:MAG: NADH-quinone oxidoreductase subunit F [Acholeplasmatales bacterium]
MLEHKLITKHIGNIDPLSIDDYVGVGGYAMFKKALGMTRLDIHDAFEASKLRGRGGAGFPVAIKLMAMAKETRKPKYVICNADEGEPGNFKDRYLMENNPHQIIEGMLIAAYATGSSHGYLYIRGEYAQSMATMQQAIEAARQAGYLGSNILNSRFDFDLEIRSGAGSYVCGEEFALLESIEGKAGRTRVKPPFPTAKGLFNQPTLINNVETLATFPVIIAMGGEAYAKIGTPTSTGTKLISLSGNVRKKGVYEVPFGVSMRKIIEELGGGVGAGRKIQMIQLGGACGPIIPEYMLDMVIDFERFEEFESKTGAGAIIVIDDRHDMFAILEQVSEFFTHESCGKCTPCREGNVHMRNVLRRFVNKTATEQDLLMLENQARVIHQTSLCGLGQTAPTAIISTLHYFRFDYLNRIEDSMQEVA